MTIHLTGVKLLLYMSIVPVLRTCWKFLSKQELLTLANPMYFLSWRIDAVVRIGRCEIIILLTLIRVFIKLCFLNFCYAVTTPRGLIEVLIRFLKSQ